MKTKSHLNLDKVFYFQLSVIGQRDIDRVGKALSTAKLKKIEPFTVNIIVKTNGRKNESHFNYPFIG